MSPTLNLYPKLNNPSVAKAFRDFQATVTDAVSRGAESLQHHLFNDGEINLDGVLGFHSGEINTGRN